MTETCPTPPPWQEDLDLVVALQPLVFTNPIEANMVYKYIFSFFTREQVAQTVEHLGLEDVRRQFRWHYVNLAETLLEKVGDPRDADLTLSAIRINLTNWFLKEESETQSPST